MKKQLFTKAAVIALSCALLAGTAGCGNAQTTGTGQNGAEETETAQEVADSAEEITEAAEASDASGGAEASEDGADAAMTAEANPGEEIVTSEYRQKTVTIYRDELTEETTQLRFYKETPLVAYMGVGEYFDLMLGGGLEIREEGNGKYSLTNAAGAVAEVDVEKGTVTSENMPAFQNYFEEAEKGGAGSFKDSAGTFLKLREVVYEGDPTPVRFDLGELGIAIYADGEDVWLPVSILSSWLSDIAQNRLNYNGRYLYVCRKDAPEGVDSDYYNTEYYDGILTGKDRDQDLTEYTYAELGFIFQYIYGYPGRTELDQEVLRKDGFDAALEAFGDEGKELKEKLSSKDFKEFWQGMYMLGNGPLEDGHNVTTLYIGVGAADPVKYSDFLDYSWSILEKYEESEFMKRINRANEGIYNARPTAYSDTGYYKHGDTAIILFNEFTVDEDGWKAYYQNGGELPEDTMGIVATGLQKAQADGEIKNVVFDLGTNLGGYSDAVAGALSLMTGREYLCGYDELSKQSFKVYFDVDRNFDGEFNEKDDEVNYDFNYGVITSASSFSCGNMFPFLVKDDGGIVIGETSGGGSCSLQVVSLSEGFEITVSGSKFKLTDESGSDLEKGVTPDIALEIGVRQAVDEYTGEEVEKPDYSAFGDLDTICEAVSDWFAGK